MLGSYLHLAAFARKEGGLGAGVALFEAPLPSRTTQVPLTRLGEFFLQEAGPWSERGPFAVVVAPQDLAWMLPAALRPVLPLPHSRAPCAVGGRLEAHVRRSLSESSWPPLTLLL